MLPQLGFEPGEIAPICAGNVSTTDRRLDHGLMPGSLCFATTSDLLIFALLEITKVENLAKEKSTLTFCVKRRFSLVPGRTTVAPRKEEAEANAVAVPTRLDKWLRNAIGWTQDEVVAGLQEERVTISLANTDAVVAKDVACLVFHDDIVHVNNVARAPWHQAQACVFALHMPRNLAMTAKKGGKVMHDKKGLACLGRRPCFFSWLEEMAHECGVGRLFSIGRLDKKTSGLLLVTNDGDLCGALCAEGRCAKQYDVVANKVEEEAMLHQMLVKEGVQLSDCFVKVDQGRRNKQIWIS